MEVPIIVENTDDPSAKKIVFANGLYNFVKKVCKIKKSILMLYILIIDKMIGLKNIINKQNTIIRNFM
jgi:hypothetical protein